MCTHSATLSFFLLLLCPHWASSRSRVPFSHLSFFLQKNTHLELVLLHKATETLIVCDSIYNLPRSVSMSKLALVHVAFFCLLLPPPSSSPLHPRHLFISSSSSSPLHLLFISSSSSLRTLLLFAPPLSHPYIYIVPFPPPSLFSLSLSFCIFFQFATTTLNTPPSLCGMVVTMAWQRSEVWVWRREHSFVGRTERKCWRVWIFYLIIGILRT